MGRIGKGTRVWDPQGLLGDGEVGRFVETGDGVRGKVGAFAFLPPGVVIEGRRVVEGPNYLTAPPHASGRWALGHHGHAPQKVARTSRRSSPA